MILIKLSADINNSRFLLELDSPKRKTKRGGGGNWSSCTKLALSVSGTTSNNPSYIYK